MANDNADAITCVIPMGNAERTLENRLNSWIESLHRVGRPYEILIVNDGSQDGSAAIAGKFTARLPHVRLLSHEASRGFGACLRTALEHASHPLLLHLSLDAEVPISDLKLLVERIEVKDEILGLRPVLVSGCRTGQAKPFLARMFGGVGRIFGRVALGLPLAASPAWLGYRETAISYFAWLILGVPLHDPFSPCKLWRTEFLRRVPIQSDGDFAHVELVAKATFLTSILDEIPLTPGKSASPPDKNRRLWADFVQVFRNPDFGNPTTRVSQALRPEQG